MLFTRQVQKKICFSFYLEPNSNSSCAVSGFPGLKLFTMAKNLNVSIVLRIILTFLLQSSGLPKNTERWKKVQLFLWLCMSLSDNRVTCEAFLFCVESCFWQQRYYFIGVLMKLTAVFFFFRAQKHPSWLACVWAGMFVCGYIYECPCVRECGCVWVCRRLSGPKQHFYWNTNTATLQNPEENNIAAGVFSRCWVQWEYFCLSVHACLCVCAGRSWPVCWYMQNTALSQLKVTNAHFQVHNSRKL